MYSAIVFLPLIGFLIAGLFGRALGARPAELITTGLLIVSAVLSWVAFVQIGLGHAPMDVPVLSNWISSGALKVDWALRIDTLTVVMLVVVKLTPTHQVMTHWPMLSKRVIKSMR